MKGICSILTQWQGIPRKLFPSTKYETTSVLALSLKQLPRGAYVNFTDHLVTTGLYLTYNLLKESDRQTIFLLHQIYFITTCGCATKREKSKQTEWNLIPFV